MIFEFIYGLKPVLEVLQKKKRRAFELFYHRSSSPELKQILQLCRQEKIPFATVDREDLFSKSRSTHHQGVVLRAEPYPYVSWNHLKNDLKTNPQVSLLILDQLQDPQNLGAIVRTALCAGFSTILLPAKASARVTSAVVKASAGATEWVQICQVESLGELIHDLKQLGILIYGTDAEATVSYFQPTYPNKMAFIFGSEGEGIRPQVEKKCDFLVSIPMKEKFSSLNVSVSVGVCLFEVLRQRSLSAK